MRLWGAERVEGIDTFVPMVETTQSYSAVTPGLEGMVFQTGLSYDLPYEDKILTIQQMSYSYYFAIWNSLSKEERYLVYDIAKTEGGLPGAN